METEDTLDSYGKGPTWKKGDRVWVGPVKMEATVIEQMLMWDYPEFFWGNVVLQYDDGVRGTSHSWQLARVVR